MALHPLHTPEFVCAQIQQTGEYFDKRRKTGRTTSDALKLLSNCINNPYSPMVIKDHSGTSAGDKLMRSVLHNLIRYMKLKEFYIRDFEIVFGRPSNAAWRLAVTVWQEGYQPYEEADTRPLVETMPKPKPARELLEQHEPVVTCDCPACRGRQ